MMTLQSKIDNLLNDKEIDKCNANALQNEIKEWSKIHCNYLMKQEILYDTMLQLKL